MQSRSCVLSAFAGLTSLLLSTETAFAQADGSGDPTGVLVNFLIIFAIVGLVYLIPSIVAFARGHPNRWLILVVNFVFGGTGIGWLGCLVWACNAIHRSPTGNNGGESGLNLFVDDPQLVTITPISAPLLPPAPSLPPRPQRSITAVAERLNRINRLYASGAITEDEHAAMRDVVLRNV